MPYLNEVTLMGHLTADPELKQTPAGAVASFTLALNTPAGDGKTRAEFFDCEVWKGWAENLARTARKGSLVLATGRLRHEQWTEPKTNARRSRVKVVCARTFHVEAQYAETPECQDLPAEVSF